MKISDINIRDPFILPYKGKYYMYGSRVAVQQGFDVYVSCDLIEWSGPKSVFEISDEFWGTRDAWAPEVHEHNGKFYMFASFKCDGRGRGTQILVSDTPDGIFKEHSVGAVTPANWECLDGTLYISRSGIPYMVFCHEWVQIKDGTVCSVRLSDDLKRAIGEPKILWHASQLPGVAALNTNGYVTDGPFFIRDDKRLACTWSSFSKDGYCVAIAVSDNGEIDGNFINRDKMLFHKDGGHGMIFKTFEGDYKFILHSPNSHLNERPKIIPIDLNDIFGA